MKKKKLFALFMMTSASALTVGLTACGNSEQSGHRYSDQWSNDATNHWHECLDDDCHETADSGAHTFGAPEVVTQATCYSTGEQKLTCTVCGYEKTETIAMIQHNWSTEWDKDAEQHYHVCTNEGCTANTAAAEHGAWVDGDIIKEATCTEDGEKNLLCEVCGYTVTVTIPAIGHRHGDDLTVTKEPTCTEPGSESSTCAICGETYVTEIPATGHTPGEKTVTKAATCTEDGMFTSTCVVCGVEYTEVIPATGHAWSEWEAVDDNFKCTDPHTSSRHCLNEGCEEVETKEFPGGEHRYGDWEVTKEATCEEEGARTHTCVVCGDTASEVIPATGHNYTQWFITTYPTETATGTATKYCDGDKSHTVTVELPKLSTNQEGYTFDTKTGVYTCTVPHSMGDIVFKMYNIKSVADAVEVALETQNQVIHSTAERTNTMITENGAMRAVSVIEYELGSNYVYINDPSDRTERFYTLNDDGTMFAVLKSLIGGEKAGDDGTGFVEYTDVLISKDNSATVEAMNGYGYSFTYMNNGVKYYGLGAMINFLYTMGKIDANKDFVEGQKTVDGKTIYYFNYGYKFPYNNYFDVVSVEFSFDSNFIVSDATLNVKTYVAKESAADAKIMLSDPKLTQDDEGHFYYDGKLLVVSVSQSGSENPDQEVDHNYEYPEVMTDANGNEYIEASAYIDDDGTPRMRVKYDETFEQLPNGTYRVLEGREESWANNQTYKVSQTSQLAEGESLPTNPYKYEDFVISSFDIELNGTKLEEGSNLEINATESVVLDIKNVLPSTYNPYFDEFSIYLLDEEGNRIEGSEVNQLKDGEIGYYFFAGNTGVNVTDDYTLTIRSLIAGEWDLYITTENKVFRLHLTVNYIAPSPLYAEVREYNDLTEKETWNRTLTTVSAYQGQSVMFRGAVGHPAYENARYTVMVIKDEATVSDCLKVSAVDGLPLYTFSAQEIGTYTVILTSNAASGVTASFTVNVKEAPNLSEMLTGEFVNENKGYSVTINPEYDGALNGTATIVKGFDNATETTIISYSYDEATRTFTCNYVEGAKGDYQQGTELLYNYGLKISDAYKLYLTYESGFDGSVKEVLIGGFENSLVCSNSILMDKAKNDNNKLVANVSGLYAISSTDSYTFISINGGEAQRVYELEPVVLYVGDYIQLWNGLAQTTVTYTIELVEAFKTVYVEGVTFENENAKLREGATLTLAPVFTPENTTQRGLVWTTSNAGVATVDENGIVTGVSAGKVTITATTSNGKFFASVEITVIGATQLDLGENVLDFTAPFWNTEYTFVGEAGKAYTVTAVHGFSYGSGQVSYKGNSTSFSGTASSFTVEGGTVTLLVSQYSYGFGYVTITIEEKLNTGEPEPNFEALNEGENTIDVYPGYIYYTIVGEPYAIYTVTVSDNYTGLYDVVNGKYDMGNSKYGSKEFTTDENGMVDICVYPGNGPGVYTLTVEKTGEAAKPDFDLLKVGETTVNLNSGYVYYTVNGEANTTYVVTVGPAATLYAVVDGSWSGSQMGNNTMEYTTDENGFANICFYPGQGPGDYTITVEKAVVEVEPDPTPAPADSLTLQVNEESWQSRTVEVGSLNEEGVTIVLEGCKAGTSYSVYWYDDASWSVHSEITVLMDGYDPTNRLTFTATSETHSVVVKSNSGTLSGVVITVYTN